LTRIKSLARVAGLFLFAFHVVLLAGDVAQGRVFDPVVAVRWIAAVALFGALVAMWRLGMPLLIGRRAAVLWVLVLFLHASAHAPGRGESGAATSGRADTMILIVVPAIAGGLAAVAFVLLPSLTGRQRPPIRSRPRHTWRGEAFVPRFPGGYGVRLAPRPPPGSCPAIP
jgi:hypothetical protein